MTNLTKELTTADKLSRVREAFDGDENFDPAVIAARNAGTTTEAALTDAMYAVITGADKKVETPSLNK